MIALARFAVLSIFHILRGFYRGLFPNFIRRMKFSLMKQSVAPESTSALVSAIALLVLIETGMCMDRNRVVTITELNLWTALTQADGFRRSENPLFQQDPSSPVLVRLLLLLLLRGAMNWLVVEGFEWLIVPLLVVLLRLHTYFYRRLLLRILDLGVESNFAAFRCCLVGSTYAEGNCNSNVPFCGMCNTQLCVGLLSCLLLVPSACILLKGCTLHVAWLRGSFLRFLRRAPWFFLRMYPLHLGLHVFVAASTPVVGKWLLPLSAPLVVPSCECSLVDG